MLLSMKFQNGAKIQDGCQNNFLKFLQDYLNLANCLSFLRIFFSPKIQNGRNIQIGRFFAQKFMILRKRKHEIF
jgi:hypothetical protein